MFFNIAKDLFKSIEVLRKSGNIKLRSIAERNIVLGGQRKKVLNMLSDFALKKLSIYGLKKSVFQYSEGLIQIN